MFPPNILDISSVILLSRSPQHSNIITLSFKVTLLLGHLREGLKKSVEISTKGGGQTRSKFKGGVQIKMHFKLF